MLYTKTGIRIKEPLEVRGGYGGLGVAPSFNSYPMTGGIKGLIRDPSNN